MSDMQLHHLSALPAGALERLHEEMVAEHRMRLIAGLKRYFHHKRREGLLSAQGLRLLENACDSCTDQPLSELDVFGYMYNVRSTRIKLMFCACAHGLSALHSWTLCSRSVPLPVDSQLAAAAHPLLAPHRPSCFAGLFGRAAGVVLLWSQLPAEAACNVHARDPVAACS
jgi:hypothetical protein